MVEEGATVVEAFQLSEALGKVTAAVQDATAAANSASRCRCAGGTDSSGS